MRTIVSIFFLFIWCSGYAQTYQEQQMNDSLTNSTVGIDYEEFSFFGQWYCINIGKDWIVINLNRDSTLLMARGPEVKKADQGVWKVNEDTLYMWLETDSITQKLHPEKKYKSNWFIYTVIDNEEIVMYEQKNPYGIVFRRTKKF